MATYIDALNGKHTNGSEQLTDDGLIRKEVFKKKIRKGIATWKVEMSLNQISDGIAAMNEIACDDHIEQGYLLEDISYEVVGTNKKTNHVIVKCTANAQTWLKEAFEE